MLHIKRIDRIGMAVADLEPQMALLEGLFGFTAGPVQRDEDGGAERVRMAVPGSSDIDWEVAAPYGDDSYLQSFIDGPAGPGLHHVLLRVADLEAAVEELRALAIEPWSDQWESPETPVDEVFIHPRRGGHGFLFRIRADDADEVRPPPAHPREGTLGIIALNHLSHAHASRDELADWYARVFGMESVHRSPEEPGQAFLTEVMETQTRQLRWEMLQPHGPDSFVAGFLERRGPSIHHVTFEVAEWGAALAACESYGLRTFGQRDGVTDDARWTEAFIHPRHTGGVLVQLFWQERPGIWV
ncbi:MAG: VOC family protein [Chloroflexi bacterium]|nr:VOC family protein [Chloroflexota bacterium]